MELENFSNWEKKVKDWRELQDKLSTDLPFKIITALTLYLLMMLFSLLVLFKIHQQKNFGLRILDLPTWPSIDGISVLPNDFFFRLVSMTLFFTFFFSLFKGLNHLKSAPNQTVVLKEWVVRLRLQKALKVTYLFFRIALLTMIFYGMYKTSGGLIEFITLFVVNEFIFRYFFAKDRADKARASGSSSLFGLMLVDVILSFFTFLFIIESLLRKQCWPLHVGVSHGLNYKELCI